MASLGVGRANDGYSLIPSSDPAAAEEGQTSAIHESEGPTSGISESKPTGASADIWQSLAERWKGGEFTIIPEDNKYLDAWDIVVIVALLCTATLVPFEVAYFSGADAPGHLRMMDGWINLIFCIDILVTFNVAYVINNPIAMSSVELYERKPVRIARKYMDVPFLHGMGSGWFWPDVLTVLPWDDISGGVESVRLLRVLKLLRMLRLVRVIKLADRWHYSLGLSYSTINLAGCMAMTIASVHWLACVWGAVATDVEVGTDTWLTLYLDRNDEPHSRGDSALYVYNLAVYYVVMTMTSVGFGDIVPGRSSEVVLSTILVFCLGFMWAYIIASITSIITRFDEVKQHFQQMNDDMNVVMETRRLPGALKMRIRRHICESFKVYRQRHTQATMKDSLSLGLQGDIALVSGVDKVVGCVWYLRGVNQDVLVELVNFFVPSIFSPNEFIVNKDAVSIITRGTCAKKGRVLGRDSVFGEDMLLHSEMLKDKIYPKTLTFVETMMLTRTDLRHTCIKFPEFQIRMRRAQVKLALWRGFIHYAEEVKKHGQSACYEHVDEKGPRPFDIGDPLDEVDFKLNRVSDALNERFDALDEKIQVLMVQHPLTDGAVRRDDGDSECRKGVQRPATDHTAAPAPCGEDVTAAADASTMLGTMERQQEPPLPQQAACLQQVLEELARMERLSNARDASLRVQLHRIEQEQAALAPRLSRIEAGIGALQATAGEPRPSREGTPKWKDNATKSGGAPDQLAMGGFSSPDSMVAEPHVYSFGAAGERLNAALGEQLRAIEAAERRLALQVESFAAHIDRAAERSGMVTILRDRSTALAHSVSSEMERLDATVRHSVEEHIQALQASIEETFRHQREDLQRDMSVHIRRTETAPSLQEKTTVPGAGETATLGAVSLSSCLASSLTPQGHAQWLKRNGIVEDAWSTPPLPQRATGATLLSSPKAARALSMGD